MESCLDCLRSKLAAKSKAVSAGVVQTEQPAMKLPNANLAVVERSKVVKYLLNQTHRLGASKARFFLSLGFNPDEWQSLADALRKVGQNYNVRGKSESGYGSRFEVSGALQAPDGRRQNVCTVWQVDKGQLAPRLITAYPDEA